jgi:multiple sugar transport system permease protein
MSGSTRALPASDPWAWWRSRRTKRLVNAIFVYGVLTAGAVVFLVPFFWQVTSSLKTNAQIFVYPIEWIPAPWVFENYVQVWKVLPFALFFKNTVFVTACVITARLLVNTVVAYGFARKEFTGRNVLFVVLLGTMMIPYQVTMIPLFIIFRSLKWINTFAPLTVPEFFAHDAFSIFLLRQFFLTIPNELEESAVLDGARSFLVFRRIYLPLSKPALVSVGIFAFINTWNEFIQPLIYINSPRKYTLTLGLKLFRGEFATDWNLLMSASVMVIVPCLIVFFLTQRYFVEGIALTGMKS